MENNKVLVGKMIFALQIIGYDESSIHNFISEWEYATRKCSEEHAAELLLPYLDDIDTKDNGTLIGQMVYALCVLGYDEGQIHNFMSEWSDALLVRPDEKAEELYNGIFE